MSLKQQIREPRKTPRGDHPLPGGACNMGPLAAAPASGCHPHLAKANQTKSDHPRKVLQRPLQKTDSTLGTTYSLVK